MVLSVVQFLFSSTDLHCVCSSPAKIFVMLESTSPPFSPIRSLCTCHALYFSPVAWPPAVQFGTDQQQQSVIAPTAMTKTGAAQGSPDQSSTVLLSHPKGTSNPAACICMHAPLHAICEHAASPMEQHQVPGLLCPTPNMLRCNAGIRCPSPSITPEHPPKDALQRLRERSWPPRRRRGWAPS